MSGRPGSGTPAGAHAAAARGAPFPTRRRRARRPAAGAARAVPGGGRGPGMMGMGMGLPPAKAEGLPGSLRRLFGTLRPERPLILGVVLLAIVSVAFNVIGPKILGDAINTIFEGALGKQIPAAGRPSSRRSTRARAPGNDQLADMLSSST